jgi:hypothetical protein
MLHCVSSSPLSKAAEAGIPVCLTQRIVRDLSIKVELQQENDTFSMRTKHSVDCAFIIITKIALCQTGEYVLIDECFTSNGLRTIQMLGIHN